MKKVCFVVLLLLAIDRSYSQNVGIGINAPAYKLDVAGTFRTSSDAYFLGNVGIGTTTPAYKLQISDGELAFRNTSANKNWRMFQVPGNGLLFFEDAAFRFCIGNGGNIGIGTTSPEYKLQINDGELAFRNTTADKNWRIFQVPGNGLLFFEDLNFRFCIGTGGNIGIGTTLPESSLHIKHAGGGGILLENANDGNKWRIYSASGDNNLTFYNNANTEIADIDDVTGTFNALSDVRYKKDIQPVLPLLSAVMQLKPKQYHFNWQEKEDQLQMGFLAQESYSLFPQLVSYDKEKDLYKMNYAGFSTVAIKAIQEQQQTIDELRARLEKVEALLLEKQ